ncbi:MAG: type II toxin-antitoxin system VapC family toxin [Gammaproteobacteria bacterium]|nr:type II toxin-antitoxin system VapC family toxin [Gammaproteobacteria bacterium]
MYLLDTNIVSELRKAKSGKANKNVISWARTIPPSHLFLSVISILELETGILLVEKRDPSQGAILRAWLNSHIFPAFSERILYFDIAIAQRCAKLHALDPKPYRDAIIAATASVHSMVVVTRNIKDFDKMDVDILNPFEQQD